MIRDALPDDVQRFVAEQITSVEQLEILLLLRGRPDVEWTPTMVSEEIRTSERSATSRLADLERRGLLRSREEESSVKRFWFEPLTESLRRAVEHVATAYAERRYTVIDLIFSKPIDELRLYADAFRFRKGDRDG